MDMASTADDELKQILPSVDDTPLDQDDDLFDVKKALIPVVARWREVGEGLRLKGGKLDEIHANHPNAVDSCMGAVVREWLKKNYNVEKFGKPTWRKLVEVVGSPAGANSFNHAKNIAQEHPGTPTPGRAPAKKTISLKWESTCRRPAPELIVRGSATVCGTTAYFNSQFTMEVLKYDLDNNEWSELRSCSTRAFRLVVVNDYITAVGGYVRTGLGTGYLNTLMSLDESTGRQRWWEIFPRMPTARSCPAVLCAGHSLVVAGGTSHQGKEDKVLNTVEIMDTTTRQWSSACSLPQPVQCMSMTMCEEKIYMLGGDDKNCNLTKDVYTCSLSDLLQSCQPSTNPKVWEKVADAPYYNSVCATTGGQIVSVGGEDRDDRDIYRDIYPYNPVANICQYDPVANSWSIIGCMPRARYDCLVAVLPHDRLLVAGGIGDKTVEIASVV